MKKRMLACLLICAMLLGGFAFAANSGTDFFIPDCFIGAINALIPELVAELTSTELTDEDLELLTLYFSLTMTDTNGQAFYYDDALSDIEVSFEYEYESDNVERTNTPSKSIHYTIFDTSDEAVWKIGHYMLAIGILANSNMKSPDPLLEWLYSRKAGIGAAFSLPNGSLIVLDPDCLDTQLSYYILHENDPDIKLFS